jgi:transcriptional regulator with XRE-family HTH domain
MFYSGEDDWERPVPQEPSPWKSRELPGRVKAILASKNLTLHQASQTAEKLYGKSSPFFLPHNLYYDLSLETFTPSLYQVYALGKISNYRLADWLRVFNIDLQNITCSQVLLSLKRTVLLDPSLDDPNSWVPWYQGRSGKMPIPKIAPMGSLLQNSFPQRLRNMSEIETHNFIYAKLGSQDAFAFPDLLPGSIIRVNPRIHADLSEGVISRQFFLIRRDNGLCCCRLQPVGKDRIIPISTHLPYAQTELRLFDEVRILGVVDLEIRHLLKAVQPDVPKELARYSRPGPLPSTEMKLGPLIRHARKAMALSFREASAMSRQIADLLGDQQYFTSPGSLSDYEILSAPPRHVHKAITLCAVYGVPLSIFLHSAGLPVEEAGADPIPDKLIPRPIPLSSSRESHTESLDEDEVLASLQKHWEGEVPIFLRGSLGLLSGIPNLSLHDLFWIGGESHPLHPYLEGGLIAILNRHKKKAIHSRFRPLWQQPIYVVLKRDGTYLCASCSLENGSLVIHSYSHGYHRAQRLQNFREAEVVGQVVTLARKLG